MFCRPAFSKVVIMTGALAVGGCSGDPKPAAQEATTAPAASTSNEKTSKAEEADAVDPTIARLDALIADTKRKELEFKETEREAAKQSETLARQRAATSSNSQDITAPAGTPLGDRQRLRDAAAKAGLAWNFNDETHSATVGDVFRAMSLSKKIEFIRQMEELAFESHTQSDRFINLYDEQGTLVAADSYRLGLHIK